MRTIVLQHWTGPLGELQKKSINNIEAYAKSINADYALLTGDVFDSRLSPPCQKLVMLSEQFDDYDMVAMLDTDMFAVTGLKENVFADISGTGLYTEYTKKIALSCLRRHPTQCDLSYAYWGGCLWRLPLNMRKRFRALLPNVEVLKFSGNFEDEGIMHRLAVLTRTKQDTIPYTWSHCSYLPDVKDAKIIHIREKGINRGPRKPKLENYRDLVRLGILE